ncbi:MAG: UDP-N-acetylmuramoyl-L-alanyl-D-glutamate--2,6-diaminopimelate ligase [Pseudomonadales bacterium]|nr:UDP-N-acetylmuramoyl-L-alanyl-D-glutamate--2,6-diaminopimelate ligase [Pseudomonadales bacterium]
MMLSRIVTEQPVPDLEVAGIKDDSRYVTSGDLFLALKGETVDGRDYLHDAIRQGAVAAVCEAPAPVLTDIPVVPIEQLSARAGVFASRFYGEPSAQMKIVAVTGTNGKTSFTHLLADALSAREVKCGIIGTMGHGRPGSLKQPGLTTPPAVDLQRRLRDLANRGCEFTVLEASSHGIVQHRLAGCHINIAVLTNITHDHLDYHRTMDAYRAAKGQLFQVSGLQTAVINRDDEYAAELISKLADSVECVDFSMHNDSNAKVFLQSVSMHAHGMALTLSCHGNAVQTEVALFGSFNVQNILAVTATLVSLGWATSDIEQALALLQPVAGRMEVITRPGKPTIIVDYAHTPDALEKTLKAAREHFPEGRLTCVFGCGGDRDNTKRAVMGEIASALADQVLVTSDNPRSEDPEKIIADITAGISGECATEVDRETAVRSAIAEATEHDVVLVAGKGHERYQELSSGRIHYSDFEVIAAALAGNEPAAIVGLGETGLSYARYLASLNKTFVAYDDDPSDRAISQLAKIVGENVPVKPLEELVADEVSSVYLSPGVPLAHQNITRVREAGIAVHGDVAMFGEMAQAPVIAITGTNGKTTVAHLVHAILSDQKDHVVLAGNVGVPVLDVLDARASYYVLEISSYQLELAAALSSEVAVVLNLSPDHLDRYPDVEAYYQTKLALYENAQTSVLNRQLIHRMSNNVGRVATFGLDSKKEAGHFGLLERQGERFLVNGDEVLLSSSELQLAGAHNIENILASLAVGWLLGLNMTKMLATVRSFPGLAHRGELVATVNGVSYINDSKATNPGAMTSAVLSREGAVHLIAGGDAKGLDFVGAVREISGYLGSLALIGEERARISEQLSFLQPEVSETMQAAVEFAAAQAKEGDVVLLSPGCASFDQYDNYAARGEAFREAVGRLWS